SLGSFNPAFGGSYGAYTSASGAFAFADVPTGAFRVTASNYAQGWIGETTGALSLDGETVTADVHLLANAVNLPTYPSDGNARQYGIQPDGSIYPGDSSIYGGDWNANRGGKLLDLVVGGSAYRFTGATVGVKEDDGREFVIRQSGLGGLDAMRKVYVPADGYFARYLEVLTNPTAAPVTVDVRITSNLYGYPSPAISATSSGDAVLDISSDPPDRWVVVEERAGGMGLADVFDGPGAADRADGATFGASGSAGSLAYEWRSVTLAPGETAAFLHFAAPHADAAAARTSAERLVQLPPEALAGLSAEELSWIRNFSAPLDGVSPVPPLPATNARVMGYVFAYDGATPVPHAYVTFKSRSPYLNRTLATYTDERGFFVFGMDAVVPADDYDLAVTHPDTDQVTQAVGTFVGLNPVNLALAKDAVVAASSFLSSYYTPSRAVDGRLGGHGFGGYGYGWLSAGGDTATAGKSPYVEVALPTPSTVNRVALWGDRYYFAYYGMTRARVDLLDGSGAVLFSQDAVLSPSTGDGAVDAGGVAGVTKVRVASLEDKNVWLVGLGELEVWGTPSSPVGLSRQDLIFSQTGIVKGAVRKADGTPASNADIELLRTDPPLAVYTEADDSGVYAVTAVPEGTYAVTAWLWTPYGSSLTAEGSVTVSIGQTVQLDLAMPATGAITGTVRKATGDPAASVYVRAEDAISGFYRYAYTNAAGQFTLADLVPGTYTLTAREPASGAETSATVTVSADQTVTQDLALVALGTLNVTVTRASGTLVSGQGVYLTAPGCSQCYKGSTDSAGKLTVPSVPVGAFTVRVYHPQSYSVYRDVSGALSAQGEVQSVSVVLPAVADVRVTAVKPGGAVVRGGTVYVMRDGSSSWAGTTDASGSLLIRNKVEGSLTVLLYVGAQLVGEAAVTITAAQDASTIDAPIVFYTGVIRGKVTAGDGTTPVSGAQIRLVSLPDAKTVATINSAADGTYLIPDLAPGSYRVTASGPNGAAAGVDVSLASGGEAAADIVLPVSVVKGRVTFYDGTSVPNPNVFVVAADTATFWAQAADLDGSYVVIGAPLGVFTLKAQDVNGCGLRGTASGTVTDVAVPVLLDVTLEPHGTVRGTITGRLRTDSFLGVTLVSDYECWAVLDQFTGAYEFQYAPLRPATVLANEFQWVWDFPPQRLSGGDARVVLASPGEVATVDVSIRP
ncbi:MAG: carboxypeptidase regulatory-like domain-containing protein, partial [Candidatus Solibacter usitatus]|nr:carboxypeptidase regulatory-like domain-containing protein [Candidatus Solibacter usitatus]